MNIDYNVIKKNKIFENIEVENLKSMLVCLSAKVKSYKKDSYILSAGEGLHGVGIVLSGKAAVVKEDYDGTMNLVENKFPSESFGEAFACAGIVKSPVSVIAVEDSRILSIDYKKIVSTCSSACSFHNKLIENLLKLLANNLIGMNNRMAVLSKRKTREKLIEFFEQQRSVSGSNKLVMPFNREELAALLFVDRSAMSRELCRMRDEGLIKFYKNKFELLY